jgi:Pilin (bacterial filament)
LSRDFRQTKIIILEIIQMNKIDVASAALSLMALVVLPGVTSAEQSSAADAQAHAQAITNVIARVGPVQGAVADFRRRHNSLPASNQEAGVGPPVAYATADLKSVAVLPDGVVQATLTATSGVDDGTIVWRPKKSQSRDENDIDWTCASPSYSTISDITFGVCEYSNQP